MRTHAKQPPPAKPKAAKPRHPSGPSFPLRGTLARQLDRVASRLKIVRILQGVIWMIALGAAMLLGRCLLDRWLDFPRALRIGLLVLDALWLGALAWIFPLRALLHAEKREHLALRIEKQWPHLKSSLVSTVQLASADPGQAHGSRLMLERLFQQTEKLTAGLEVEKAVPVSHLKRPALLALALVLCAGILGLMAMPSAGILFKRYLGFNELLPTQTRVRAISEAVTLPMGSGATLAARAEGVVPRSGRLLVRYDNGQSREFPVSPDPAEPGVFRIAMQNIQSSFTYRFVLNDGRGSAYAVNCQMTPVIRSLTSRVDFPAYTGWKSQDVKPSELTLLNGSSLALSIAASQPLKAAQWHPQGAGEPLAMKIDPADSTRATLSIPVNAPELTGFSISLLNQEGVASRDDATYPITVTSDKPPEVKLLEPVDPPESLTPAGGIDLVAEILDDFGIAEVNLCVEAAESADLGQVHRTRLQFSPGQKRLAFRWTPGKENPPAKPGDSLTYYIEAKDNNTATGPGVAESTRSTVRIVTPEVKQQEIGQKLQEKAAEINQLRESQRAVTDGLNKILQDPSKQSPD